MKINIKESAVNVYNVILDFLFPPKCVYCGKLSDKTICKKCYDELTFVNNPDTESVTGANCYSAVEYKDDVRQSFHNYKFNGKSCYASTYAGLMNKVFRENKELWDANYISYVPLSKKRLKKRGYNQAKLLADELSALVGVPTAEILIKSKNTGMNSKISDHNKRKENVMGVYKFSVDKEFLENKKIILIDDVVTSGATLSECVKTINSVSNAKIVCMTYAKA